MRYYYFFLEIRQVNYDEVVTFNYNLQEFGFLSRVHGNFYIFNLQVLVISNLKNISFGLNFLFFNLQVLVISNFKNISFGLMST